MRRWHGLSQEELAADVGLSRQTISSLERSRSTPSVTVARALAARLDISIEELFSDEELR